MDTLTVVNVVCVASQAIVELPAMGMALVARFDDGFKWVLAVQLPGIMVSYETVRRWVNHFGPMIAANLRKRRPKPYTTWHLDEVYVKIDGRMVYLWRAVDAEGEVLDVLVQAKRNKRAALKLMRSF